MFLIFEANASAILLDKSFDLHWPLKSYPGTDEHSKRHDSFHG